MYKGNNTAIRSLTILSPGETIGPDLVPTKIDLTDTTTDPQTLAISGIAHVTFQNIGDARSRRPSMSSFSKTKTETANIPQGWITF